jgi:L-iditol 2-dehydrogenase
MRAVVYRGVNDLRWETVPVPRIGDRELLVKVAVCGVCPTDIKKIQYGTIPPPRVFGHETAGTIVQVGARLRGFKPGDRVALHHHVPCLDCHFCRHRAFAQCATYKRTGITAGFEPAGGGYAEYVRIMNFVLPGVVKIPGRNSFAEGAMLEPVNTVLKAVRRLNLLLGDAVLVAGQGPIGLMFTRLLQLAGARVLATDLLESRLRLAKQFGAKWTFRVRGRTPGALDFGHRTLDACVITVPSDEVARQALQLVRGGGQVLLFAHTKRAEAGSRKSKVRVPIAGARPSFSLPAAGGGEGRGGVAVPNSTIDFASVCLDEKDLIGSYSSDFTLQDEVAHMVFSRRLDVRRLITHYFPLVETAKAVALAAHPTPGSLKVMVRAEGG